MNHTAGGGAEPPVTSPTPTPNQRQMNLNHLSEDQLWDQLADTLAELRRRGAIRTGNHVGDLGESLIARCEGVELPPASTKGYDVLTRKDERIQVKTMRRRSDQRYPGRAFVRLHPAFADGWDAVAVVALSDRFRPERAWRLPKAAVLPLLRQPDAHGTARLYLKDVASHPKCWSYPPEQ